MSARITATIIASGEPITVNLDTAARGPAGVDGADGAAGPNAVTSATTSDGTANLSVATISSQGAVLINPEFDNGIIAEESGGRSVFRVGGVIISAAEGSVDCGQVDTITVNTTTLRASSTEYGNNATFTYGNATAVANHLTALGGGATGVDVFQAATIEDVLSITRVRQSVDADISLTQTTPNSVDVFDFPVVAGVDYEFYMDLRFQNPSTTAGCRLQAFFPDFDSVQAGGTSPGFVSVAQTAPTVAGLINLNRTDFLTVTNANFHRTVKCIWLMRFTSSGNFRIAASQSTADADNPTLIKAGSRAWLRHL